MHPWQCLIVFIKSLQPPLLVGKEMRRNEEHPVRVSASKADASWSNIQIFILVKYFIVKYSLGESQEGRGQLVIFVKLLDQTYF